MSILPQNIPPELAKAAERAGIRDVDALGMMDLASLPRDASGSFQNADAVVEQFRQAKPHLFAARKHARDMSKAEFNQAIQDIGRAYRDRMDAEAEARLMDGLRRKYPNAKQRS
jgi:cytosine/adenosine deaminase-related metal-dependent hydrolase